MSIKTSGMNFLGKLVGIKPPLNVNFVSSLMKRGREIFPEADYGYASWIKDKRSELMIANYRDPFMQGTCLVLRFGRPRVLSPDGRYGPGFDCFDSSYWLYSQLNRAGIKANIVSAETPVFANDHVVLVGKRPFSLTPGFDMSASFKVRQVLAPETVEQAWRERPSYAMPLDKASVVLRWEAASGSFLVHWIKISFTRHTHIDVHFTTDLISSSRRVLSFESLHYFSFGELDKANDLIAMGRTKKALSEIEFMTRYFDPHPRFPASGEEKAVLKVGNEAMAGEMLPHVIPKLADLLRL